MIRTVLIDGDIVLYRAGFAGEHVSYMLRVGEQEFRFEGKKAMNDWIKENEPETYSWSSDLRIEPLSFVLGTVKRMIANIKKDCAADEVKIYLSDKSNFRHDVATIHKYKGNRDDKRAPLHIKDIRRYLMETHNAIVMPNLEADDALAIDQTKDTVIASIDKDLLQIPGKHYNFVTGAKLQVSPETALRHRMEQILTGDRTDNIPGIYRVGPARATKLLAECETEADMYAVIYDAWDEYLQGDHSPEWVFNYDEEIESYIYKSWTGKTLTAGVQAIVAEIDQLITVGEVPNNGTTETGT